jgi:hypothetical protein
MNLNRINRRLQAPDGDAGGGGGGGDWRAAFGTEGAAALKDFAQPGDFLKAYSTTSEELGKLKGAPAPSWYSDANKDYVANKGFKTGDDAITSLKNLETLLGAEKAGRTIVLPKDEKDAEGVKAYRAKIGVPETPEGYELPVKDGDNGAFAKQASAWLHAAGIPKAAGQALAKQWNEHYDKALEAAKTELKAQSEKQIESLKAEWGDSFDKNSEQARRFMKAAGFTDEEVGLYEETFGTANMLKRWAAIGEKLGEAGFAGGGGGGGGNPSASAAREQLETLRKDYVDGKVSREEWERKAPALQELAAKG